MILLSPAYVTTVQATMNGQTTTTTTDTLFVSSVELDLLAGIIYATIQRGTGNAPFASNMPNLEIVVNPNGSFFSQGGDRDYVGFSAQNVEKVIPEAIQSRKGPEQYLSFDDRPVIAALCNAIKELTARIIDLERKS